MVLSRKQKLDATKILELDTRVMFHQSLSSLRSYGIASLSKLSLYLEQGNVCIYIYIYIYIFVWPNHEFSVFVPLLQSSFYYKWCSLTLISASSIRLHFMFSSLLVVFILFVSVWKHVTIVWLTRPGGGSTTILSPIRCLSIF